MRIDIFKYFHNNYWVLKRYRFLTEKIYKRWQEEFVVYSDSEIKEFYQNLLKKYHQSKNLDTILIDAFAICCEAIYRVAKLKLHKVQIIGAIALHEGNVAQMKTGEGKTLTSILAAYLNSFKRQSVFIVTVNEYLVERDYQENGLIFAFLGLSVGRTLNCMQYEEKLKNYRKDIVYGTNSEFGFDYLRDNMLEIKQEKLQRNHYFVIVDEVDSVLIDEGRTPLIISGNPRNRAKMYEKINKFVKILLTSDYKIDFETKRCFLEEPGKLKARKWFAVKNLYDVKNSLLFHNINNAIYAHYILKKNIDYLVKDKKILLIDHFTGRVMADRMLSEGLHQALQSKENCEIQDETKVLATITYQNYFRIFDKISGMTGTAKEEAEEFIDLYNMHVIEIPTNKKIIRDDDADFFFYNKRNKYLKIIDDVKRLNQKGQPILIGTSSVEISEEIAFILKRFGFKFCILNAKNDAKEAQIVKNAGISGTITISTNMAGRGTDIKLDEKSRRSGGLAVLSIGRNDARRIDRQLQGRSGRQGDPGYSAFYISFDDQLFLRFSNRNFKKRFKSLKNETIHSHFLSRIISKAQKRLQNMNYDQRKTLLEYDNVISQQRMVVYSQRDFIVNASNEEFTKYIENFFLTFLEIKWKQFFASKLEIEKKEIILFLQKLEKICYFHEQNQQNLFFETLTKEQAMGIFYEEIAYFWKKVIKNDDSNIFLILKKIFLKMIDNLWTNHLDELFRIKSSSFLHSYAQKKPLQNFIEESHHLFLNLKEEIILKIAPYVFKKIHYQFENEAFYGTSDEKFLKESEKLEKINLKYKNLK